MTPLAYTYQPRTLTAWENAAITAQCIKVRYPDDKTPVRVSNVTPVHTD